MIYICVCNETYKRIDHFQSHQEVWELHTSMFENDDVEESLIEDDDVEESLIENTVDVPVILDSPTCSDTCHVHVSVRIMIRWIWQLTC